MNTTMGAFPFILRALEENYILIVSRLTLKQYLEKTHLISDKLTDSFFCQYLLTGFEALNLFILSKVN